MFWNHSKKARRDHTKTCIAIVGMNATGKSNFGKRLAAKLKMKRIDTDSECRKKFGSIQSCIDAEGLAAFRKREEQLVLEALRPGNLVVLSGGAIESETVRNALKERATVIWIRAGKKQVVRNIAAARKRRHEFKQGAPKHVAADLLKARTPLYEEVADITLQNLRYRDFLPVALTKLEKLHR